MAVCVEARGSVAYNFTDVFQIADGLIGTPSSENLKHLCCVRLNHYIAVVLMVAMLKLSRHSPDLAACSFKTLLKLYFVFKIFTVVDLVALTAAINTTKSKIQTVILNYDIL